MYCLCLIYQYIMSNTQTVKTNKNDILPMIEARISLYNPYILPNVNDGTIEDLENYLQQITDCMVPLQNNYKIIQKLCQKLEKFANDNSENEYDPLLIKNICIIDSDIYITARQDLIDHLRKEKLAIVYGEDT